MLLELLEKQHTQEIEREIEYCKLVQGLRDPLLKTYFDSIAFDVSKHVYILSCLIPSLRRFEGAPSVDTGLSLEEMGRLRESKKASEAIYLKCLELANTDSVRLLIKTMILDEDHHFKLVTELITRYAKLTQDKKSSIMCSQCGYELPKTITINMAPKDIENRVKDMLLTIYCPRCNAPYYNVSDKEGQKNNSTNCYS